MLAKPYRLLLVNKNIQYHFYPCKSNDNEFKSLIDKFILEIGINIITIDVTLQLY